jgi:hypothetical protein
MSHAEGMSKKEQPWFTFKCLQVCHFHLPKTKQCSASLTFCMDCQFVTMMSCGTVFTNVCTGYSACVAGEHKIGKKEPVTWKHFTAKHYFHVNFPRIYGFLIQQSHVMGFQASTVFHLSPVLPTMVFCFMYPQFIIYLYTEKSGAKALHILSHIWLTLFMLPWIHNHCCLLGHFWLLNTK